MRILFSLILVLAFSFRIFGINWDQGHHLHPDERMIIMVADRIHLPINPRQWQKVTTPDSPLNPKFFAYGSFPIYLLKGVSVIFKSDNYGDMLYVGRTISILFDLGTVILVFLIAKQIVKSQIKNQFTNRVTGLKKFSQPTTIFPLLSMFFYAVSVLPIQSSNFFISDIPLTFLTTLVLYLSIKLIHNSKFIILNSVLLGISLGLSLATKITAILLIVPIFTAVFIYFVRYKNIKTTISTTLLIIFFAGITFSVAMPYAIIDFPTFKAHTLEQSRMRTDPFVFPFTLQYVNTTPYWYFVKNLIFWGMGLPLGLITVIGTIYVIISWLNQILIIFFVVYFLFMGISAVKFMRYLLPLYPLLCIFASLFIFQVIQKLKLKPAVIVLFLCFISFIWPLAFMSIYKNTHTRIAASEWIYKNIPNGAKIALEHWDDGLPLRLPGTYKEFPSLELPLYEADTPQKWDLINERLKKADYIVIASNRLYTPLMKMIDCDKLRPGICYKITAEYYQNLFAGKLGFTKVAEFVSNPKIQLGNFAWEIDDQSADESFTVYDHPKIMIFAKSSP